MTPEAALRLERVTRIPSRFWNNLETQYQDRKARLASSATEAEDFAWLKSIPTKELIKRNAIPGHGNQVELLEATLSFFGVASVSAWKAGWSKHHIAFRKSAGTDECTGGIAAWVRLAELKAAQTDCSPFDADRLKSTLKKIRGLTFVAPDKFVTEMRSLFAAAGVALVLVPEIPGSKVSGAARWLSDTKAMIAVNLRGKSNDKFWFTLFHEVGHILNDRRDEVFVDVDYGDDPRERAANEFARDELIPPAHSKELKKLKSMATVRAFALRIGIHPGIVVGRLQYEKIVPYTHMNDLKARLHWADA